MFDTVKEDIDQVPFGVGREVSLRQGQKRPGFVSRNARNREGRCEPV
jgi:hypothetical protein